MDKTKILSMFPLKVVIKKKKITRTSDTYTKVSRLTYCVCNKHNNGEYMAHLNMKNDDTFPDTLCIPFTPMSADLRGKLRIFSKLPDENGNILCIIRDEHRAKTFPGDDDKFTPFRNNYVYSGHIVKYQGKHYFDVYEAIGFKHHFDYLINGEEDDKPLNIYR